MAEEHVRGRMPLESNPGNRNPAIPPVYDTTGKEDYRRVTPENPLPTKDKDLDERLTAIENKLDSVIENGSLNTQLTGSITEKYNGDEVVKVRQMGLAYKTWYFDDKEKISVEPGAIVEESGFTHVNGFSTLTYMVQVRDYTSHDFDVRLRISPKTSRAGSAGQVLEEVRDESSARGSSETIAPYVSGIIRNRDSESHEYTISYMLRV